MRALGELLLVLLLVVAFGLGRATAHSPNPTVPRESSYVYHVPSVGGTAVPSGLHCAEDDIVGYTASNTLGCAHIEGNVVEGGTYAHTDTVGACQRLAQWLIGIQSEDYRPKVQTALADEAYSMACGRG